jgi:hypothetical protein
MGSSAAAKESLAWLALPSSGAFVAATFALSVMIIAAMRRKLPVAPVKTVRTISAGEVALKER